MTPLTMVSFVGPEGSAPPMWLVVVSPPDPPAPVLELVSPPMLVPVLAPVPPPDPVGARRL